MRKNDGRETWHRLSDWDKGQAPAERLAAVVLLSDGFRWQGWGKGHDFNFQEKWKQ